MTFDLDNLDPSVIAFLTGYHLATLSTQSGDGSPQVTPVGVTYQPETRTARIITWATSIKARNIARQPGQRVAVCQVDRGRWLTLYGTAEVTDDPTRVDEAVRRYTERYRPPKERDDRVAIEISVTSLVGRV